jgi:hypothetical protein
LNKISKPNSGDDGFTVVIKRSKIPIFLTEIGLPGIQKSSEVADLAYLVNCLRSEDNTIQLNSKVYQFLSATSFTKEFLKAQYDLDLKESQGEV